MKGDLVSLLKPLTPHDKVEMAHALDKIGISGDEYIVWEWGNDVRYGKDCEKAINSIKEKLLLAKKDNERMRRRPGIVGAACIFTIGMGLGWFGCCLLKPADTCDKLTRQKYVCRVKANAVEGTKASWTNDLESAGVSIRLDDSSEGSDLAESLGTTVILPINGGHAEVDKDGCLLPTDGALTNVDADVTERLSVQKLSTQGKITLPLDASKSGIYQLKEQIKSGDEIIAKENNHAKEKPKIN